MNDLDAYITQDIKIYVKFFVKYSGARDKQILHEQGMPFSCLSGIQHQRVTSVCPSRAGKAKPR